jgi:hypothetical protein
MSGAKSPIAGPVHSRNVRARILDRARWLGERRSARPRFRPTRNTLAAGIKSTSCVDPFLLVFTALLEYGAPS